MESYEEGDLIEFDIYGFKIIGEFIKENEHTIQIKVTKDYNGKNIGGDVATIPKRHSNKIYTHETN